jgi:hypothetical protein
MAFASLGPPDFSPIRRPDFWEAVRKRSISILTRNTFAQSRFQPEVCLNHWPSRPRELHPQPLTEPCLKLSLHTARATRRRLPPSSTVRLVRFPVDLRSCRVTHPLRSTGITIASSLLRGSPPLTNASILSASCCRTCTFSLCIIGQVLKFRTVA